MPTVAPVRILIVEDDDDSRAIIGRVLRDRSHVVHEARDAANALALFAVKELDLVICDIGLPDLDGNELLARMRNLRWVRTIAITGHRNFFDQAAAEGSGFSTCIIKPIDLPDLLSVVEQA
jgi:CheY-like chemotaxis protein